MSAITTRVSCDCDDTDIDMTYRMCCLTVGDSPSFKAATMHHLLIGKSSRMDGGASKEKSKLPEDKKSVTWVVISLTMDELKVQSMVIDIDRSKWESQRHHSA